MNIEREYYELDEFWNPSSERAGDRARIEALADAIPPAVESILDIGCGNGIFVNRLQAGSRKYRKLLGLDRSIAALRYVTAPKVCASVDDLPLGDRAFDLVAALEVFEHLPVTTYTAALGEACRLAGRYVLVSVPYRQNLREALIECPDCCSRFNPDYHLRSFDESGLSALLAPFGFRCARQMKLGGYLRYRGVDSVKALVTRQRSNGNPFSIAIPCPVCGFRLPGAPSVSTEAQPSRRHSGPRAVVKSLWPKKQEHTWIAALYERAGEA